MKAYVRTPVRQTPKQNKNHNGTAQVKPNAPVVSQWQQGWLFWLFSVTFHAVSLGVICVCLNTLSQFSFTYGSTLVYYWATWLQFSFFGLAVVCNLTPRILVPDEISPRGWLHEFLLRLTTSSSLATCIIFMIQYFMKNDVFSSNDPRIVLGINVLAPLLVLLESILMNHSRLPLTFGALFEDAFLNITCGTLYVGRIVYRHAFEQRNYPYPILNSRPPIEVAGICAAALSICWLVSLLFNLLCPRLNSYRALRKAKKT
ncbi:hypothetical protein Pelo_5898 [Pelomyxa schiedti]|nr:hypothetical protein Pelo_5898 [Pelomyxa schiedti]